MLADVVSPVNSSTFVVVPLGGPPATINAAVAIPFPPLKPRPVASEGLDEKAVPS
jgi:hypothetical protein